MQEEWNLLMKNRCIIWLVTGICLTVIFQFPLQSVASSADKYANFAELAEHETEGEDYQIEYTDMGTELLILSPHGGGIEGGVSELVRAFSADYSTYLFEGIKPSQNWDLHITSNHFDEPQAVKAVKEHNYTLAFHGYHDIVEHTLVEERIPEGRKRLSERCTTKVFQRSWSAQATGLQGEIPKISIINAKQVKAFNWKSARLNERLFFRSSACGRGQVLKMRRSKRMSQLLKKFWKRGINKIVYLGHIKTKDI
ncbi:hypothetical protein RSC3_02649 [Bacillus paralicheniformis]|nr:hypothetical protein RSC3_02649 [Bacillus paralicheniformis]